MPYFVFIIIYWLTAPVRMLMFWWPHRNLEFALTLLFRNRWVVATLMAQAYHETGNFQSELYVKYNNAFGMGKSSKGLFQSLFGLLTPDSDEPDFATYFSVANSVYDLYDWLKNRSNGKAIYYLKEYSPKSIEYRDGFTNDPATSSYIFALKESGYYAAPYYTYLNAVYAAELRVKVHRISFWVCCVVSCVLPLGWLRIIDLNRIFRRLYT